MRCRWVLLAGLLVFSHPIEAVTTKVFEGRYRLALGRADRPIDRAVVWVYVIGWGGLERVEAGVVRGGVVHVRLDSADVPVPTPESFLVAIEFPDGRWYRGPDFPQDGGNSGTSAEEFIGAFDAYFRRLSSAKASADRVPLLVLPAFVERRVRLLHEDGSPLVGRQVPIDVYVTQRNHCGAHRGLHFAEPLAVETTDERGQVVFMSQPGVGLYLVLPRSPRSRRRILPGSGGN